MLETVKRSKKNPRAVALLAALGAVILGGMLVASPAYAAGSFTVKVTPSGCTQMDFFGSSLRTSGTNVQAYSGGGAVICNHALGISARVSVNGVTSSTATSYTNSNAVVNLSSTYGTPSGHHCVDGANCRNT